MTIIFDDELTVKSVDRFTNDLDNMVRNLKDEETIDVYFSTNGGEEGLMYAVINTIKKYSDKLVIYLIDIMYSCGFSMLWYLRDYNIYMLPSFQSVGVHTAAVNINTREKYFNSTIKDLNKDHLIWSNRLKELGLSNKKIKKFLKQEDIYFSRKQTLKLFPNIQEIE